MNILLVDGYNIIGAWPELQALKNDNLEHARDFLIEKMSEYQAYTGFQVIIVFDAHLVKGNERKYKHARVEVIFTRENETADERIEKLVRKLLSVKTKVYVATSDYTEQWTVFSQGALRKSARELLVDMEAIEDRIQRKVRRTKEERPYSKIKLSDDVVKQFEKWRRGNL